MNPVDNYLECLYEGEKWDKVKSFAKKHKGKLIAGAGIATAIAGGLAYKNRSKSNANQTKTPVNPPPISRHAQNRLNDEKYAGPRPNKNKDSRLQSRRDEMKKRWDKARKELANCPVINGKRSGRRIMGKFTCNT